MPDRDPDWTAPAPLAHAIRQLAFRCAEEGWHAQARTLLNEAQLVASRSASTIRQYDLSECESERSSLSLEVSQFGRFQIARNGALLGPYHSKRAIWVLRYLLSTQRRVAHKGEIATLLWPNSPSERAYHSLHVAVGALRTYLDLGCEQVILFANDCYLLNDAVSIRDDSALFQSLVDHGDTLLKSGDSAQAELAYDAAIALYVGDYDVVGLDFEWAMVEQRRHAAAVLHALDRDGSIAFEAGRYGKAVAHFRRLLQRDPYREDVLARLMVAYSQLGRRGDAAREYARCTSLLMTELGVEPSPELKAVYRNLLGNDPGPRPVDGSNHSPKHSRASDVHILTLVDDYVVDA
jgi:DNA-binding SARP family transcriptional activator